MVTSSLARLKTRLKKNESWQRKVGWMSNAMEAMATEQSRVSSEQARVTTELARVRDESKRQRVAREAMVAEQRRVASTVTTLLQEQQ